MVISKAIIKFGRISKARRGSLIRPVNGHVNTKMDGLKRREDHQSNFHGTLRNEGMLSSNDMIRIK